MSYNPIQNTIEKFIGESCFFNIPRNQRKYVWQKENIKQLIEDIYNIAVYDKEKDHFLGSFVLYKMDRYNYGIIDGQQRITTIQFVICALLYRNFELYSLNGSESIKNNIDYLKKLLFTQISTGIDYKLKVDNGMYKKIVGNFNSVNFDDIKKTISDIDQIFKDYSDDNYIKGIVITLDELNNVCDNQESLDCFQEYFFNTNLIKIITDDDVEGYSIFEILNARGVSLRQIELLKNYIFRYIGPKEGFDKCKDDWNEMYKKIELYSDDFLNHFIRMYYGDPIKQEENYKYIRNHETIKTVENFYYELLYCSRLYTEFVELYTKKYNEYMCYKYFEIKGNKQIRSLLLSFKYCLSKNIINQKLFEQYLTFIKNYFIGFNLMGITSNRIDKQIISCSHKIYISKTEDDVNNAFKELLSSIMTYYPNKKEFSDKLFEIKFSNHYKKGNIRSGLLVFLLFPVVNNKRELFDVKDFSIDHIISDSDTENRVWEIGNLMPLRNEFHKSIKSEDTQSKLVRYKESGYVYLKEFYNKNKKFNIDSIVKRTQSVIDDMIEEYYIQ